MWSPTTNAKEVHPLHRSPAVDPSPGLKDISTMEPEVSQRIWIQQASIQRAGKMYRTKCSLLTWADRRGKSWSRSPCTKEAISEPFSSRCDYPQTTKLDLLSWAHMGARCYNGSLAPSRLSNSQVRLHLFSLSPLSISPSISTLPSVIPMMSLIAH